MHIVITGGIAAGKSTVLKRLAEKLPNYDVISIDEIVNGIYDDLTHTGYVVDEVYNLRDKLLKFFTNGLSKEKIAADCVKTPSLLPVIEEAFMPMVKERLSDYIVDRKNVLIEFPLLVEMGNHTLYDYVVNVEADHGIKGQRALERPGMTGAKLQLIRSKQATDEQRRAIADYTFTNHGQRDLEFHTDVLAVIAKTRNKMIAVTSGSFDPITNGHLHLIRKGLDLMDEIVVIVAGNFTKKGLFEFDERVDLINQTIKDLVREPHRVHILALPSDEMIVGMASTLNARYIIRGLRNGTDFEYERQIDLVQKKVNPDIETLFFMTPRELTEVSSSLVKGIIGLKGWDDIAKNYVPECVMEALRKKFGLK